MRHLASPLAYPPRPSRRAQRASGKKRQPPPISGRVFNRAAVEAALRRAVALWGRLKVSDYPNGAIIFCSEEIAAAIHPPRVLQSRLYSCGRHFDTSVLQEQLESERAHAYGIIVIDGSDACIGSAKGLGMTSRSGCSLKVLANISSTTAAKTRRGGQSALRYARNREIADLAFLRKVAERAGPLLADVRGIVLAGKADAKNRLLPELAEPLRKSVICILDLPCSAGIEGLRLAAARAASAADSDYGREARDALSCFMERVATADDVSGTTCCYGKVQTVVALNSGAVETLLISAESEAIDELTNLAKSHGTQVYLVDDSSSQGSQFCNSFIMGGCLRWSVDPALLDAEEQDDAQFEDGEGSTSASSCEAFSIDVTKAVELPANSTALPESALPYTVDACGPDETSVELADRPEVLAWLTDRLATALEDSSTADALVAGVEVVLGDEVPIQEDALNNAIELLAGEGVPQRILEELKEKVM